jgi:probable rRNA maturation factor
VIRLHIRNLQKKLPPDRNLVRKIVQTVCSKEISCPDCRITICFVTDPAIRKLNARFHGSDVPTDVLAFSLGDGPECVIADVFVSADTAVAQAKDYGTRPAQEMCLYVIHGLLHIAGFNDLTKADRLVMRRKEKEYLVTLGIIK